MKLKKQIKNVTEFSKHYWSKGYDSKSFVRHCYLAYAYLRNKDLKKTEDPLKSRSPVHIPLFALLVRYFKYQDQSLILKEVIGYKNMFESYGFKTVGVHSGLTNFSSVYIHGLISKDSLTRLGQLVLSDKDISKYAQNWKDLKKIQSSSLPWWKVNSVISELSNQLNAVICFSEISLVDSVLKMKFLVDDKEFVLEWNMLSKNADFSLIMNDDNGKSVSTLLKDKDSYDALNAMKKMPLLSKLNNKMAILNRALKEKINNTEMESLTKDEIVSKLIPQLEKMGLFVEFSFYGGKVLCQIIPSKLTSGPTKKYRSENNSSMEEAFDNALKIMIDNQLMWEML